MYIPTFTCTGNDHLPLCTSQFMFSLMDDSTLGQELINTAREFLRLLSYLTLDMGWTPNDIIRFNDTFDANDMYADEHLIDTFHRGNTFKVNYHGYCKYTKNKYITKRQCYSNGNNGMDIMTVLMRDIGIQLGGLSSLETKDSLKLGNSVVSTYKLATESLFNFIWNDAKEDNMFARIVLGVNETNSTTILESDGKPYTNFEKVIIIARIFNLFNEGIRIILMVEMIISCVCLLSTLFSLWMLLKPISSRASIINFLMALTYILLATTTFLNSIILQIILKTLAPSLDDQEHILPQQDDWGLIRVTIGSGFIFGCFRYAVQVGFFIISIVMVCLHKRRIPEPTNAEPPNSNEETKLFNEILPPVQPEYSQDPYCRHNHWCGHI